jgi:hypothetical protein
MDERVRFVGRLLDGEGMSELCRSNAAKLVTGPGKGGGVSVAVEASHISKQGLIRHGRD